MNKLLLITALSFMMIGCSSENEEAPAAEPEAKAESGVKAFHPTDDVNGQSQGGKGHTADGSEVHLP
tara:strand:+ start:133 stop:333 length:201 start_codon:yes stop_codon:yes gene_type:complete